MITHKPEPVAPFYGPTSPAEDGLPVPLEHLRVGTLVRGGWEEDPAAGQPVVGLHAVPVLLEMLAHPEGVVGLDCDVPAS